MGYPLASLTIFASALSSAAAPRACAARGVDAMVAGDEKEHRFAGGDKDERLHDLAYLDPEAARRLFRGSCR